MQVLTLKQVESIVLHKKTWIYSKIKIDEFPPPKKLSPRKAVWLKSEIDEWMSDKLEVKL